MSLGVLNNLSAVYAENNLNNSNSSLNTTLQQLSSGSKINSGANDAAGLSLVDGLQANQQALTQSETNASEGVGLLQVADGALSQVTSLLNRAVTLATEASNGTLNSSQDTAANQEYQSILSEISNIGTTTTYNDAAVFGSNKNIYTGDSSVTGSSIDALDIRSLSSSNVGDSGGVMAYSNGANNVFLNLSSSGANAKTDDSLGGSSNTMNVTYLVKGADGSESTATTSIAVGGTSSYQNTVGGLISAINNSGLGLTANFATQAQAGVQGGGTQTGIEITGGVLSAGVDPSAASTSGMLNPTGISASELLTQGQSVTVTVGGTTVSTVAVNSSTNTLQELATQINTASANGGTGSPSEYAQATVVTNGDGTQSLSLASTAGNGALTVTTGTNGNPAAALAFSGLVTATNTVNVQNAGTLVSGAETYAGKAGILTVSVPTAGGAGNLNDVADSSADTVTGKIVINDGNLAAQTFVMGASGATTTASSSITTINVHGNNMSTLATAIAAQLNANGDTGATAAAGSTGLVITSGTKGNAVTATSSLLNTNDTLGVYTPTDQGTGVYGTALLALTNTGGTQITGTIGASDVLSGSVVLTDGSGTATTFTMGGSAEAVSGSVVTVNGNTIGALQTAINDYTGGTITGMGGNKPAGFAITATPDNAGASGGLYLQSGTSGNTVTVNAAGLSDTVAENNMTTTQAAQAIAAGSAASATIGPQAGSVNSGDTLTGQVVISNTLYGGGAVTHTFVMGGNSGDTGLSGSTYTVNGSTLANLAAAVTADTALRLTGLASTAGLTVTQSGSQWSGVTPTLTSTSLVDTTAQTASSVTLGSFASENDTVSGNVDFYVGTTHESFTLAAGSTVDSLIQDLNNDTGANGVNASWVAGSNGAGSILITSNTAGTAHQISSTSGGSASPTSAVTDTTTTATLSYTTSNPYNMGLSGSIGDTTSGQAAATYSSDIKASSGTATISYSDAAGQSLSATDLSNQTDAEAALTNLNTAITDVAAQDGYIGAQINTLNAVSQVLTTQQENVESAQNAVQATDYASATSNMSKYEILSQTGIAALAQANSIQQEVTKLLQ